MAVPETFPASEVVDSKRNDVIQEDLIRDGRSGENMARSEGKKGSGNFRNSGGEGLSWADIVEREEAAGDMDFVVSEVDGKKKVTIPKDVFIDAKPLWEDFVIGKFLSPAPHIAKIYRIVNGIWRLGGKSKTSAVEVFVVNSTTVKFKIKDAIVKRRVLNKEMWSIAGVPMIVAQWTPFEEDKQPALKSIALWVHLQNVPPSLYTDKGLKFLAKGVGKLKKMHPKTTNCVNMEEAQLFVEADLTKELPEEFSFSGEEDGELETSVTYTYPWLPSRCSKWGHNVEPCLSKKGKSTEKEKHKNKENEVKEKEKGKKRGHGVGGGGGRKETENVKEQEVNVTPEARSMSMVSQEEKETFGQTGQMVVTSLENTRSSPVSQKFSGERNIDLEDVQTKLSNSYAVLGEIDSNEEDLVNEGQEVSENMEDIEEQKKLEVGKKQGRTQKQEKGGKRSYSPISPKRVKVCSQILSTSIHHQCAYGCFLRCIRLGRIWVVWSPKVRITPCFTSSQMITCSVLMEGMKQEFFCSFVYAFNSESERRQLWEDIKDH